eukprot:gene5667-6363_t
MGCSVSNHSADSEEDANDEKVVLLLLGSANSGKTTLLKQMRIINMQGFAEDERLKFTPIILSNIICCMLSAIDKMKDDLEESNSANDEGDEKNDASYYARLMEIVKEAECYGLFEKENVDLVKYIIDFYENDGIKEFIKTNSQTIYYADIAMYYSKNLKNILRKDYVPSVEDILCCRMRTVGINEICFTYQQIKIIMVDVGGQRTERRKWINCFEDVDAVIFCASLNEYNMQLEEDCTKNAMQESLDVFGSIINSQWFKKSQIILLLNKVDIFKEKINTHPLTNYFDDFTGDSTSFEDSVDFIKQKYTGCDAQKNRQMLTYPTCATNTENIEYVTTIAFQKVLRKALAKLGVC